MRRERGQIGRNYKVEMCIGMREFVSKYPHLPLPGICFVSPCSRLAIIKVESEQHLSTFAGWAADRSGPDPKLQSLGPFDLHVRLDLLV